MRHALSLVRAARVGGTNASLALRAVAAAVLIVMATAFTPVPAHAADCKPPSYCRDRGACMTIAQVSRAVNAKFASQGYSVSSVRLRGHAPTATCLWYEVSLKDRSSRSHLVYWNVTGGQVR